MPIVQCSSRTLFKRLGRTFTEAEFTDLCFAFGIELDDVTSEKEMYLREAKENVNKEILATKSDEEVYKIELPANRYDLLCVEGLTTALLVFMEKMKTPQYKITAPKLKMTVDKSILPIRPYVVCAVLRNVQFTEENYKSFIDLQEKLHHNIARKRTLVSVGTHDLDTVSAPFSYEGTPKQDIDFLPLAHAGRGNLQGPKITEYYANDKHIGQYVPLISGGDAFPVVYGNVDGKKTTMSLPPIINSEHSKITLNTKNVFIEATAKDFLKANIVLNMIVTAFSEYCGDQFSVEAVEVEYPEKLPWLADKTIVTPNFDHRQFDLTVEYINKSIGIDIGCEEICLLLEKMLLSASPSEDKKSITVQVPCTRADILHNCDVMEDVAIAYGYKNILKSCQPPKTLSYGKQQPREALRTLMRMELASAGYTEMMTFSLCTHDEACKNLNREEGQGKFYADGLVTLGKPCPVEFEICRPSLLPGTMKTLAHSKGQPQPLQLYEVTDVVVRDPAHRLGAKNLTRVCAVRAEGKTAGFSEVHGLFEFTMARLEIKPKSEKNPNGYYWQAGTGDDAFYPGWQVDLFCFNTKIGSMGIIHPKCLKAFGIPFPCSYMEYDLDPFFAKTA
eukprot:TRINITY_DN32275_c0_g1_i1.p2 TRINITY_DN32275_c0_g1~~TRINITY_DN32275_c0_g1_i1.p2  ORF type:complete len:637 (+),score=321.11 TRINITY_DN32275_c0_g1_i1:62-1912(+)